MSKEKLSGTARRTIELVARVGALVRELRTLADDAGVADPDAPAEQLPTLVAQQLGTRVSALETAVAELEGLAAQVPEQISRLDSLITSLDKRVTRINTELSGEVLKIKTRLNTLEQQQPILSERIENLERQLEQTIADTCETVRLIAKLHPEDLPTLLTEHPGLARILSRKLDPEEFASLFPDVVAVCEPDESWFAFSPYTGNNNDKECVGVAKTHNGLLMRSDCHPTADVIHIYSADRVTFLNLKGYKRFYIRVAWLTDELRDAYPDLPEVWTDTAPIPDNMQRMLTHLSGCAQMQDLRNVNFTFGQNGSCTIPLEFYGDWSSATAASWACTFGTWGGASRITRLPDKIAGIGFNNTFLNTYNIQHYPEIDFGQVTRSTDWVYGNGFDRFYPGTVYARVRNLGHVTGAVAFNLLKNWDIDDMRYTLLTASVKAASTLSVQLHRDAYSRLTATERAQASAKNFTLISKSNIF